jgi:hypothetical protein
VWQAALRSFVLLGAGGGRLRLSLFRNAAHLTALVTFIRNLPRCGMRACGMQCAAYHLHRRVASVRAAFLDSLGSGSGCAEGTVHAAWLKRAGCSEYYPLRYCEHGVCKQSGMLCVCSCVCVRACVHACMRACMCVRACVCVCAVASEVSRSMSSSDRCFSHCALLAAQLSTSTLEYVCDSRAAGRIDKAPL